VKHTYINSSPTGTLKPKLRYRPTCRTVPGCFKSTTQTISVYQRSITTSSRIRMLYAAVNWCVLPIKALAYPRQGTDGFIASGETQQQELEVQTTKNVSYTLTNTTSTNPILYEVVYQATNSSCPAPDVNHTHYSLSRYRRCFNERYGAAIDWRALSGYLHQHVCAD